MLDRSRILFLGAALAAGLAVAAPARADMVQTIDGKWFPEPKDADGKPVTLADDEQPSDDALRASASQRGDAGYDVVKLGGKTWPAGQVKTILATDSVADELFRGAMNEANSGFFVDAAEKFGAAAAELQGFGKQIALKFRMDMLAAANDVDGALAAANDLVAAFPKTFYLIDVAILRAKVAATRNSATAGEDATKALAIVVNAKDMNNRDLFRAEGMRIFLALETKRKFDEAEKAWRDLVGKIERSDPAQGAVVREQGLVGIGNCLVAGKKDVEAKDFFDKATASRNADILAGAYLGLGNVAYSEAKVLRDGGKLPEAKERLIEASLHYLRVTIKYATDMEDTSPLLDAYVNQARVFDVLFEMSGRKDCETADRAWKSYQSLLSLPSIGSAKSQFLREFRAFDEKKKAACSVPAATGAGK
jgi:hypothetical protein